MADQAPKSQAAKNAALVVAILTAVGALLVPALDDAAVPLECPVCDCSGVVVEPDEAVPADSAAPVVEPVADVVAE